MNRNVLAAQLAVDEDLRLKPYDDATGKELKPGDKIIGNITIAVGRNLNGNGISKSEAMMLLGADLDRVESELDAALPWWRRMSERRQQALANMCFNLGINRLLGFRKALDAMYAGDYERAAREMLDSLWAKQVGQRAQRLAQMMREG